MPRKSKVVAHLTCGMTYAAGSVDEPGVPLPAPVLAYHRRIENELSGLSKLKGVTRSVSGAADFEIDGIEFWRETFWFGVTDLDIVDTTADRLERILRSIGIKFGHKFSIEKQLVLPNGERDVYTRRIYPKRATKWKQWKPALALQPAKNSNEAFPSKLKYLAGMARRCDGIGGNDIFNLFPKPSGLVKFLEDLSPSDRSELISIYQTIVRKKHNEWFLKWLKEHDEYPQWALEFTWFLSVLDRLRQGGLLLATRGKAKRTVLLYWDDYLSGKPYTEEAV
jgi:hypothetical protein